MKYAFSFSTIWVCFFLTSYLGYGQIQLSPNTVNFKVTYDRSTNRYTAFVIPNYSLPSSNNPGPVERGSTAQYTLKVPVQFTIQNIQDIRGSWEKNPMKFGPGQPGQDFTAFNLDPAFNYYIIGKSSDETDYGSFAQGVPVALFSFQGNGCFGPISPLPPNDPFIAAAENQYALNVANSFYSRSGQPAGGNVVPLEQFVNITGPAADCRSVVTTPDSRTTALGTPVIIAVLTNDLYKTGGPASLSNVTPPTVGTPTSGTAAVNPDGTITYTPAFGFTGPASFSYTICDLVDPTNCSSTTVTVTVQSAPPTAIADSQTTAFNTPTSVTVLANDLDKLGNPASLTNVTVPTILTAFTNGTASINATTGVLSYTPNAGFTGTDVATYQICDLADPTRCASTTVSISVQSAPPVPSPDSQTTTVGAPVTIAVLGNDLDKLGNPASLTNVTLPAVGTPTSGTATVNPDGTITYTPAPGFTGPVSFSYTICDVADPSKCASTTVSVNVLNQPPVANPDNTTTGQGVPVSLVVTLNDTDVDGTVDVATVDLDPTTPGIQTSLTTAAGSYTVNNTGQVTFSPVGSFTGVTAIPYTVNDNLGLTSLTALITIGVGAGVPPVALADNATTPSVRQPPSVCWLMTATAVVLRPPLLR